MWHVGYSLSMTVLYYERFIIIVNEEDISVYDILLKE